MHKNEMFLKDKENLKKENNIIFLDIEGVLTQDNQNSQKHDLKKTAEYLSINYRDDIYNKINPEDIGTFFYDFDNISIGILHELIENNNANIVLSSNYKNISSLDKFKALFRIHNLDRFLIDYCNTNNYKNFGYKAKEKAIEEYINNHNIDNYMIIDDYNLTQKFGHNFRRTSQTLKVEDIKYANLIFNKDLKVIQEDHDISLKSNNQELLKLKYLNYKLHELNILYLELKKVYCYEYDGKEYIEYLINHLTKNNNLDYILLNMNNIHEENLNISGAVDNDNIYTINNTCNDIKHKICDCKKKILSINN